MGLTSLSNRIIGRYGRAASIIRESANGGDPWAPTIVETAYAAMVALTNFTASERAGTLIAETDRKAIVSLDGLTITPTVADKLRVDGVDYSILSVRTVETKGNVHLFTLRVSA